MKKKQEDRKERTETQRVNERTAVFPVAALAFASRRILCARGRCGARGHIGPLLSCLEPRLVWRPAWGCHKWNWNAPSVSSTLSSVDYLTRKTTGSPTKIRHTL